MPTQTFTSQSPLLTAVRALHEGKLVGLPTETVYGLAGNALNSAALASIFEVKQRPHFDPLIVHLPAPPTSSDDERDAWWRGLFEGEILNTSGLPENGWIVAKNLAQSFWPGPLTMVLPKGRAISDLATSGLDTVAIRVPAHPLAQALLKECRLPLAAPSANRFGRISPTTSEHVHQELGDKIPSEIAIVLDGGPCTIGVESTVVQIVSTSSGISLLLLRPGAITSAELERVSAVSVVKGSFENTLENTLDHALEKPGLAAPGMLASHYAPKKMMILVNGESSLAAEFQDLKTSLKTDPEIGLKAGMIHLTNSPSPLMQSCKKEIQSQIEKVSILETSFSKRSELSASDVAQNLFARMRELDEMPESEVEVLIIENYPDDAGLGAAIRDRLQRAATKRISNLGSVSSLLKGR